MRITNRMMTNNMLSNINRNKYKMSDLEQQYSTGKKIQRPSDDPIVTVRALKLRTNLSEIEQYYNKNIPDAMSWMDLTESALSTVNDVLRQINTYCVQGSSDTLTANDRSIIVQNLEEMKEQIHQEANANFAGRYVFTGFKTDTPLAFREASNNIQYEITENFTSKDIEQRLQVVGGYELDDFDVDGIEFDQSAEFKNAYRIQLSYGQLDSTEVPREITYSSYGADGTLEESSITLNSVSSVDGYAYTPAGEEVNFIHDTGEIIIGEEAYNKFRKADDIQITYSKTNFTSGDLRPEHYFDCITKDISLPEEDQEDSKLVYTKANQEIQYEINYNQMLTVNTQASDAISHKISRVIEDIYASVDDVTRIEENIKIVESRLENTELAEDVRERYEKMLGQFETELSLKKEVMQKAFSKGIAMTHSEQDKVNAAVADLGSRYVRLQLTENRLGSQKTDMEELLSINEDADLVDTIVRFNASQVIYNASLSAASRIVQNTLLDFLR